MKGYKAFKKGLICINKQYQENTVFEEEKADVCQCGMHFCENPLDTLEHYPLIDENGDLTEFAEVEALNEPKTDDNKKFCTTKLKIGAKLNLSEFVKASVDFIMSRCKGGKDVQSSSDSHVELVSSGCNVRLASSDNSVQLATSGYSARLATSGKNSKLVSSGEHTQLASSGFNVRFASSGICAKLASSGYNAQLVSSGEHTQLASSGNYAKLASSGYSTQLASSGDYALLMSTGDSALLASSGNCAKLNINGANSVGAAIGINNIIRGALGAWITLAEWQFDNDKKEYICVCVKSAKIDGEKLKPDTWYELVDGKFTEV